MNELAIVDMPFMYIVIDRYKTDSFKNDICFCRLSVVRFMLCASFFLTSLGLQYIYSCFHLSIIIHTGNSDQ